MVNMYSMGMTGYGMYGMGNMYGASGNVHQDLKQRYGVGNEDLGTRPYAQPYPMAIIPRAQDSSCQENAFCRFLKKCYGKN